MQTTYHNKFNNYSPAHIEQYIEDLLKDEKDAMLSICHALLELKERGLTHYLFEHKYLRYFELIATGQTTINFVSIVEGNKAKIMKLAGYPHELLEDIALGREFDIALVKDNDIVETRKRMTSMSLAELNRVFVGDGKLSTVNEQKSKLREELALRQARAKVMKPVPANLSSRLVARNGAVYLKNERLTVEELIAPLSILGYKLQRV